MAKQKLPKISALHEEIPDQLKQFMHLTRLAEMGKLTASIAHEINNPLSAILGFAENIELMLEQSSFNKEKILLQVLEILKCANRASDVIKRMNQMSRQDEVPMAVVDLAEIALTASEYLQKQMRMVEAEFIFEFSKPIPIQCDSTQVEQIIINILSNALHAVGLNGKVRKIKISFSSDETHHQVRIWNNGPPISEDVQKNLMEPFFTTKKSGEGTGLGLSISRTIMHAHDGELSFKSDLGSGTEFNLSFPRLQNEPWQEQADRQPGKVLIVDPQLHFQKTQAEKFKMLGYEVVLAKNSAQAREAIQHEEDLACALYDIIPGSSESLDGLRKLRQALGPHCPIFTVSRYPSARENPQELKGCGATECYEKPLRIEHFSAILEIIHRQQKIAV